MLFVVFQCADHLLGYLPETTVEVIEVSIPMRRGSGPKDSADDRHRARPHRAADGQRYACTNLVKDMRCGALAVVDPIKKSTSAALEALRADGAMKSAQPAATKKDR